MGGGGQQTGGGGGQGGPDYHHYQPHNHSNHPHPRRPYHAQALTDKQNPQDEGSWSRGGFSENSYGSRRSGDMYSDYRDLRDRDRDHHHHHNQHTQHHPRRDFPTTSASSSSRGRAGGAYMDRDRPRSRSLSGSRSRSRSQGRNEGRYRERGEWYRGGGRNRGRGDSGDRDERDRERERDRSPYYGAPPCRDVILEGFGSEISEDDVCIPPNPLCTISPYIFTRTQSPLKHTVRKGDARGGRSTLGDEAGFWVFRRGALGMGEIGTGRGGYFRHLDPCEQDFLRSIG